MYAATIRGEYMIPSWRQILIRKRGLFWYNIYVYVNALESNNTRGTSTTTSYHTWHGCALIGWGII